MPRVVPDQRSKFENEEFFRKLSRECEIKYTGFRDRPHEERQTRFQNACRDGRSEIAFVATGTNLSLQFFPASWQGEQRQTPSREYVDLEREAGKIAVINHNIPGPEDDCIPPFYFEALLLACIALGAAGGPWLWVAVGGAAGGAALLAAGAGLAFYVQSTACKKGEYNVQEAESSGEAVCLNGAGGGGAGADGGPETGDAAESPAGNEVFSIQLTAA